MHHGPRVTLIDPFHLPSQRHKTIYTSYVRTPLVEKQIASQAKEHGISEDEVIRGIILKPMPKGVFISIEELYGIAAFLVSDCARNITGQTIVVDGGWTVR